MINGAAEVVCAGVMVADVLVQGADESVFKRDITRVPAIRITTGGDALNQAINLSAMGVNVEVLGKVGVDSVGEILLDQARRQGVEVGRMARTADLPTSITVVLIAEDGKRCFIGSGKGTNSSLCLEDFDLSALQGARILSLGSLYGSISLDGAVAASVLKAAKQNGCVTVVDMMHGDRFPYSNAKLALPYVDYFLPNEEEARLLTGCTQPDDMAEKLLSAGVGCVVIKQGAKGCLLKNKELRMQIPAFPANVVDTTGAGDAMVAGFITGLLDGCTMEQSVQRGCAAGSIATEHLGATGALVSKEQVLGRMRG